MSDPDMVWISDLLQRKVLYFHTNQQYAFARSRKEKSDIETTGVR